MRRIAISCACAAAAAALLVVPAGGAGTKPRPTVKVLSCHTGGDSSQRFLVVRAKMRAAQQTDRMSILLKLQRRDGRRGWQRVTADGLDRWTRSQPGVGVFSYRKRIEGLGIGTWRVVAHFRWLDAEGEVQRRTQRTSVKCRQPDPRADLVIRRFEPGGQGMRVTIANTGNEPSGGFIVGVGAQDGVLAEVPFGDLAPGERRTISFDCRRGTTAVAIADLDNVVDELHEGNNRAEAACG